jgi:uracil-DNA glycosylase family protein
MRADTSTSAADFLPYRRSLAALRSAAQECRGCPLYANSTQVVFSEGVKSARIVFVGEQPGDKEDIAGRPFVGPAGNFLRKELENARIPESEVYLTNAVKHFKWQPRGKRRLHAKPSAREVRACRPWLEAELKAVQPAMVIALGATAAQSLFGSSFRVTERRGESFASEWADWNLATYHPSALLRAKNRVGGQELVAEFQHDLQLVAMELKRRSK